MVWRQVTGTNPPHPPLTAKEYKQAGIPWFDYYRDDLKPLKGSKRLAGVKSVAQLGQEKNSQPLPENSSITPELIVQYGNTRRPRIRELLSDREPPAFFLLAKYPKPFNPCSHPRSQALSRRQAVIEFLRYAEVDRVL